MKLEKWIVFRINYLKKSIDELAEDLVIDPFILAYFEEGTLKRSVALKIILTLKEKFPNVDADFFTHYTVFKSLNLKTGESLTIKYHRNLVSADNMGETFGQHIEPHGEYMSFREQDKHILENYEYGEITFVNPLVIPHESEEYPMDANEKIWGWKSYLVDKFKAKGLKLSNKLKSLGYDAIITTFVHDGETQIGEIVNFSGIKK